MDKQLYTKEEMEKEKAEALVAYQEYVASVSAYHEVLRNSFVLKDEESNKLLENIKKTIKKNVEECKGKMSKSLFDLLDIA